MKYDYLVYRQRAVEYLATSLGEGTLVLFLGAGASLGAGLPRWRALVEALRLEVGLTNTDLDSSAESLEVATDEVSRKYDDDQAGFADLVQRCLYRNVKLSENLLQDSLLIALGALMMGSRRGSVKRVVTLNFDSVLEWYISLYGFVPRVVLQPPVDEGAEDVRIYHPHGFLPHPDLALDRSDFVILSRKSINLRLGKPHDEWIATLRHILSSGVSLFIGLSGASFRDRALAPILAHVSQQVEGRRPTGFWVLNSDDESDEARKIPDKEFLDYHVVPLRQSSNEIPRLLLDVCKQAAKGIPVSK